MDGAIKASGRVVEGRAREDKQSPSEHKVLLLAVPQ